MSRAITTNCRRCGRVLGHAHLNPNLPPGAREYYAHKLRTGCNGEPASWWDRFVCSVRGHNWQWTRDYADCYRCGAFRLRVGHPPPTLRPGDVLLYTGEGLFSIVIRVKTWSRYSHIEIYDGSNVSVASRDGIGVGRYPVRYGQLTMVLRPRAPFNLEQARAWFTTVDGQGYDWIGLTSFTIARWQGRQNDRQFCSEFATRYLRAGGIDPFNEYDADGIAPGEFPKSSTLAVIWPERKAREAS